jgi:F0F1-type ATP synthase delta subunit
MPPILNTLIPVVIAHVVILVVVIVVIKRLLLSDTARAVSRVKQVETEVRKREQGIREEIAEHEKEFEKKKEESRKQLDKEKEEAQKKVAEERDRIIAEANQEKEKIIEDAKSNRRKMEEQLKQEMKEQSVDYAGELFNLVFSENVTPEIDKKFMDELLGALEEVDAANITVSSDEAEFKTAHPLDPEQKQRLEKMLKEKFNVDVEVKEDVDDSLIGGMIFKLGSLQIDGSLKNRFEEAVEQVKKEAHAA